MSGALPTRSFRDALLATRRTSVAPALALFFLAACRPDAVTGVSEPAPVPRHLASAVQCTARIAGTVSCAVTGSAIAASQREALHRASLLARRLGAGGGALGESRAGDVTLGGQGIALNVVLQGVRYRPDSSYLEFDGAVQNLLGQPLGSADGVTADTAGVKVFFASAPAVTQGTGLVSVANADGTGTFTASGQPYYRYAGGLAANATSAHRPWRFALAAGVESFTFELLVTARVFDESGVGLTAPTGGYADAVAGNEFSCARRESGQLHCWGDALWGRTGRGYSGVSATPAPVSGGVTFTSLSGGYDFFCGLASDSRAWCWGDNSFGNVGDGTRDIVRAAPAPVASQRSFTMVDAGSFHACALDAAGEAWCWGSGGEGALGPSSTTFEFSPIQVRTDLRFRAIAAGGGFTCGIRSADSTAWCWGLNGTGELGNGTGVASATPVAVAGGYRFVALASSYAHSCGVTSTGTLACWGFNGDGQLGDGSHDTRATPVEVAIAGKTMKSVSVSEFHSCAVATTGEGYCWGHGGSGQLGTGDFASAPTPQAVSGGAVWAAIEVGNSTSCGRLVAGGVRCWGDGYHGVLGDGSLRTSTATPVSVTGTLGSVAMSEGYPAAACATTPGGTAQCWGANARGQLGDGRATLAGRAVAVLGGLRANRLVAGSDHACLLTAQGAAHCWGANDAGQLGDGTMIDRATPVAVSGGHVFTSIAAGTSSSCALKADGRAWCWGANGEGTLGDGTNAGRLAPVAVAAPSGGSVLSFTRIAVGGAHACGVTAGGGAWCWGSSEAGQLGSNSTTSSNVPVPVTLPAGVAGFSEIAAGARHGCALATDGRAFCWGAGAQGRLGNGGTSGLSLVPVAVSGERSYSTISAGFAHSCAVTSSGAAWCWGMGSSGQIGNDDFADVAVPTLVSGGDEFAKVRAGWFHSCGETRGGQVRCWGSGFHGANGSASFDYAAVPTAVALP